MNQAKNIVIAVVVILLVIVASGVPYTLGQSQDAVVLSFGRLSRVEHNAGLHFKLPFVDQVRRFSTRVLSVNAAPQNYTTKDGDNISVDYFIKWRIKDAKAFYEAFGANPAHASASLEDVAGKRLGKLVAGHSLTDLAADDNGANTSGVLNALRKQFSGKGIKVVDMRVRRINLPDSVSQAIYARMKSGQEQLAKQIRARGEEQAETIRAKAQSQRADILAQAYQQAQTIRGDGDARAAAIYADAYHKAPAFYRFYRSMEIYRHGWNGRHDWMVVGPDRPLLKPFGQPSGAGH